MGAVTKTANTGSPREAEQYYKTQSTQKVLLLELHWKSFIVNLKHLSLKVETKSNQVFKMNWVQHQLQLWYRIHHHSWQVSYYLASSLSCIVSKSRFQRDSSLQNQSSLGVKSPLRSTVIVKLLKTTFIDKTEKWANSVSHITMRLLVDESSSESWQLHIQIVSKRIQEFWHYSLS